MTRAWVRKSLVVVTITFCGVKGRLNGLLPVIGPFSHVSHRLQMISSNFAKWNTLLTMQKNGPHGLLKSRCTLHTVKRRRWAEVGWMRHGLPFSLRLFKISEPSLHWCHDQDCVVGMGWGCAFHVSLHPSFSKFYWPPTFQYILCGTTQQVNTSLN